MKKIRSAYEVKNNCCLFERLNFKVEKNGILLFGISFFVLKIFTCTFLYYANEESIWGDKGNVTLMNELQLLQNKAAKIILSLPSFYSSTEALKQLCSPTLFKHYGKQHLLYQGIAEWNSLDKSIRDMRSLLIFKEALRTAIF